MNPETPTPRSDKARREMELATGYTWHVDYHFARILERELIASREDVESLKNLDGVKAYCKMMAERDSLRQQLEETSAAFTELQSRFPTTAQVMIQKQLCDENAQLKLVNEKLVEALKMYIDWNKSKGYVPGKLTAFCVKAEEAITLAREMGLGKENK